MKTVTITFDTPHPDGVHIVRESYELTENTPVLYPLAMALRDSLEEKDRPVRENIDGEKFIESVARFARLYQRELITAQEFTNVTLEEWHRTEGSPTSDTDGRRPLSDEIHDILQPGIDRVMRHERELTEFSDRLREGPSSPSAILRQLP